MTVLSPESRLAGAPSLTLPRVNLLPPEIAERAAFRKVQLGLGAAVLATMGVVGVTYVSATHGVSEAQTDLAAAQTQSTALQEQLVKYSNVTDVYVKAAAAEAMLKIAMGDEIRYSQLLNDISLSVPTNVWLKSVTYAASTDQATSTASATSSASAGVGTFTVEGVAFSHNDVAVWLESIAALKTYVNPYFSNSTEHLIGTRKVVNFNSTATLTAAAHSGRYNKPVGG